VFALLRSAESADSTVVSPLRTVKFSYFPYSSMPADAPAEGVVLADDDSTETTVVINKLRQRLAGMSKGSRGGGAAGAAAAAQPAKLQRGARAATAASSISAGRARELALQLADMQPHKWEALLGSALDMEPNAWASFIAHVADLAADPGCTEVTLDGGSMPRDSLLRLYGIATGTLPRAVYSKSDAYIQLWFDKVKLQLDMFNPDDAEESLEGAEESLAYMESESIGLTYALYYSLSAA
jgi:hypothetical protein